MAQFAAYRNPDTRAAYPLPLDLRNDRLGDLDTRVSSNLLGFSTFGNKVRGVPR